MSRKKISGTPHYEMLYIIANKFTEEEVKPIIEKVDKLITDNGGEITFFQEWGKKKMAYPIKHNHHGYYELMEFDLPSEKLAYVNTTLRMMNEIVRHQIVAKKIKSEEELKQEKRIAEKIAAKAADEDKKEKIKEEEKAKDAQKMDLKDLDSKLDKILETDDLF